jgi:PleD family two-component response regulator
MKNEKKILVIDDEKMNILSLAHILKSKYNLIVAADGKNGLEVAKKHIPDLILLDIIMPDLSGFEVIKKLKEDSDTKNIPVIFLSGLANTEDIDKGMELGAVDFITKPFNSLLVKAKIESQISIIEYFSIIKRLKEYIDTNKASNDPSEMELFSEVNELLKIS